MKKIIIILFVLFYATLSNAQEFGSKLKLGANFSQVDGDNMGGYNKLGANIGIEINRSLNDKWDAFTEIRYSMKGARTPVQDPEGPAQDFLKLNFHYIELPLMVRYKKFEHFPIYAGLSVGVNVFNQRNENGIKLKEAELLNTEFAFHLGFNYEINDKWEVDLRKSISFISVRDYDFTVISPFWWGRAGWYHRLFTLGLNYNLR